MSTSIRGWQAIALTAAVSMASLFAPAYAQQWQSIGLSEQEVVAVETVPGGLIAGTQAGLYRFDPKSETWTPTLPLSLGFAYWSMAADAIGSVYCISGIDIFAHSTDSGMTWKTMEQSEILATFGAVRTLATDKENNVYVSTSSKLYRSSDRAESWKSIGTGLPANYPDVKSIVSTPSGSLLAGTSGIAGGHLFISDTHGDQWKRIYQGEVNRDILSVAATPTAIVLAVYSKGLLRSTDTGKQWNQVSLSASLPASVAISQLLSYNNHVYALASGKVYSSTDEGHTWAALPETATGINHIDLDEDGVLYAATSQGVLKMSAATGVVAPPYQPSVSIVPMPAHQEALCTVALSSSARVYVRIYDIHGKVVHTIAEQCAAGIHTFAINTTSLAAGLYSVQIEAGGTRSVHPLSIYH